MRRLLLLQENLHRAQAEIAFVGRLDTLDRALRTVEQIADCHGITLRTKSVRQNLDSVKPTPLPAFLGVARQASEFEAVNRVRVQLDGLYDDLRSVTDGDRAEVALLWYSLPRAEAEIEFCARTRTLDRIREVAGMIAVRHGTRLLDLDSALSQPELTAA